MRYLIDGYNLLHAMGVLAGRTGPGGLEKARRRLLGLLRGAHGEQAAEVTVVFDAAGAPPGVPAEQEYQGVQVRFALRREADDLIEELIRRDPAPRSLTVVSDDRRLRQAARRRRCPALGCEEYLDELDRRRPPRRPTPDPGAAKPEGVSRAETNHWLSEFAGLDDDPAFKELADPPEFREPPE
jgi:predicted RNA-binding protein with PIN domain